MANKVQTFQIIAINPSLAGRFVPFGCGYDAMPGTETFERDTMARDDYLAGRVTFGRQAVSAKQAAYLAKKDGYREIKVVKLLNFENHIPQYEILFDATEWS